MPHELDTKKSFMSAREPAWHRLGIVKDSWFTAEEALVEALLDYTVGKGQITVTFKDENGKVQVVSVDEWEATCRLHPETGDPEVLGIVKKNFAIFQNRSVFNFMDEVVGNIGGAHYETAGALRGGRQLFLSVSTDSADIVLDPKGRNDKVKRYILAFNGHDGSMSLSVIDTPVRVVCANTLAMAMGNFSGRWETRHVGDIGGRAQQAKEVLGIFSKRTELLTDTASKMIAVDMTDNTWTRILEDLFVVEVAGIKEADREGMERCRGLYELAPTNANITGTLWGGLQSIIEYADWQRGELRGSDRVSVNEMRFRRQLRLDGGDNLKQRAWDRVWAEVPSKAKKASVA
jgi:phage/plasmid-like protein (TIGR03299 family)